MTWIPKKYKQKLTLGESCLLLAVVFLTAFGTWLFIHVFEKGPYWNQFQHYDLVIVDVITVISVILVLGIFFLIKKLF